MRVVVWRCVCSVFVMFCVCGCEWVFVCCVVHLCVQFRFVVLVVVTLCFYECSVCVVGRVVVCCSAVVCVCVWLFVFVCGCVVV